MAKQRFGNELHPLYLTWLTITQRCNNPNHSSYKNYGARGVKMSEEFKDFKVFAAYLESLDNYDKHGKGVGGFTLDRIDNSLGYARGNLRWASRQDQIINSRKRQNASNKYIGIGLNTTKKAWNARITVNGVRYFIGAYPTEEEALEARNQFIQTHGLPMKIQAKV